MSIIRLEKKFTMNDPVSCLETQIAKNPIINQSVRNQVEKIGKNLDKSIKKLNKKIVEYGVNKKTDEKAYAESGKKELEGLKQRIGNISANLPIIFKAKETRSIYQRISNSFLKVFVAPISRRINLILYIGSKEKKNNAKLQKKLEKIQKLEQKIRNALNGLDLAKNSEKIKELKAKINAHKETIRALNEKVQKNESYRKKGNLLKENFAKLGGERVTLKTADNVDLDGLFVDARKFREKLASAGCQSVVLKSNSNLPRVKEEVNAIRLTKKDFDRSGGMVINALKGVGAFAEATRERTKETSFGVGWQIVYQGEDILIVPNRDLPMLKYNEQNGYHFADHLFFNFNSQAKRWEIKENSLEALESQPIDKASPSSGTVILSSGNRGIYEQNKNEITFFLLRNMNVMVFNFRGYGGSEGEPTKDGLNLDMESAYQFVKNRTKDQDKKIVFKALCLSAATAAYVAGKHPETNLILDQTFSSLKDMIQDFASDKIDEIIKKHKNIIEKNGVKKSRIARLAGFIISLFAPHLSTSQSLAKNKGKKAIFYSFQDEIISLTNVMKNIKAISKAGQLKNLTLISGPGGHAAPIIGMKASSEIFSQQELQKVRNKLRELHSKKKEQEKEIRRCEAELEELDRNIQIIQGRIAENKGELNSLKPDMQEKLPGIGKMFRKKIKEDTSIWDQAKDNQYKKLLEKQEFENKLLNVTLSINKLNVVMDDLYGDLNVVSTGQIQLEHFLNKSNLTKQVITMVQK